MSDSPTWRVTPSELPLHPVSDPTHIEGEIEVRVVSRDPFVLVNTFAPNTKVTAHSHGCDTLYVFVRGEFHIEGEGVFRAGDIRFVRAGHVYGPEWAGPEGATLQIIGLAPGFDTAYAD
jgi:mannose-6-phosphate isomerase-like protein (cupin superfamily)